MENERINLWKEPKYLPLIITSSDLSEQPHAKKFSNFLFKYNYKHKKVLEGAEHGLITTVFESTKEIIFDYLNNTPILHFITFSIDATNGQIQICHSCDATYEDESEDEIREDIKFDLALAKLFEIPVYPNTDEALPILAKYHHDLLLNGFRFRDKNGNYKKYLLTKSPFLKIENFGCFEKLSFAEMITPAELHLMRRAVQQEFEHLTEAERILKGLRSAIAELEDCLKDEGRNEGALQKALTLNPILFGAQYIRILPKHTLGSEFEMDYALERTSGDVDLVEIEASNLPLFTKNGNPTKYLIHAEQQILDWLHWIERNHAYVREKLTGILKPIGYVVIGRKKNMSESDSGRLQQRNVLFRGSIEILTYDDLLTKSKNLLGLLEGL
jgi:hypothetical protein